jgi:hypothetical protein
MKSRKEPLVEVSIESRFACEVKPTPALRSICYLAGITITSDELAKITELAIGKYDSELDDVIAKIAKSIEEDTIALTRRKLREADSDIEIADKDVEEFIFMRKELTH